ERIAQVGPVRGGPPGVGDQLVAGTAAGEEEQVARGVGGEELGPLDHDARWQRVDPPLSVLPGELDGLLELAALLTEDAARVERAHLLGTQRVLRAIR